MRRLGLIAVLSSFFVVACSSSHGNPLLPGDDGGTLGDANTAMDSNIVIVIPDGGIDLSVIDTGVDLGSDTGIVATDSGMPVCGNGVLEAGEQCDDGDMVDTNACNNMCRWNAYCGNHRVDSGEVCDDGNNFSGDGCSSNCLSDETCGNHIVDIAAGEVCDGTTGCSSDCHTITTCGNGTVDAGEECDDNNTESWDGCSASCKVEVSFVINTLALGGAGVGCDYSGDGRPDNAFGHALGPVGGGFLNGQISSQLTSGMIIALISMVGLDDLTLTNDPSFRTALMQGADGDLRVNASNNFSGTGTFRVAAGQLSSAGLPMSTFQSALSSSMLSGGPEDFNLNLGTMVLSSLPLRRGFLRGDVQAMGGGHQIANGVLCGAIAVSTLAATPNFLSAIGSSTPCAGTEAPTFADVIVGGAHGIVSIPPTQPDVDVDGDGLEHFEVASTGAGACQAVITACIDGDGTRTEGHRCALSPAFADGLSAGLTYTAVNALIIGHN